MRWKKWSMMTLLCLVQSDCASTPASSPVVSDAWITLDRNSPSSEPTCNRPAFQVLALRKAAEKMTCGIALSQANERADTAEKSFDIANQYASNLGWWAHNGPLFSGIVAGVVAVLAAGLGVFTGYELGRATSYGK